MDSPELPTGSPMFDDDDEGTYPCKGCGKILEEGKAFELSGNRWHIECFRCNKCQTLLDSDANLLLLGDGSLICNNCTYSCTACHNKIEDLAILTGDQAFCAGCFRCRNCKRKIENLKYARTSQGIFCMSCHETLMARRRKRGKAQKTPTMGSSVFSPMPSLDKSLPSLPLSPRPRPPVNRTTSSKSGHTPDQLSPLGFSASGSELRSAPRNHRYSMNSQVSEHSGDGAGYDPYSSFIPVALDPSPAPPATLPSAAYRPNRTSSYDPYYQERSMRESPGNARPSYERKISEPTPYYETEKSRRPPQHIASQEKGRQMPGSGDSMDIGRRSGDKKEKPYFSKDPTSTYSSPYISREPSKQGPDSDTASTRSRSTVLAKESPGNAQDKENFKLGEVPRERKKSLGTPKIMDGEEMDSQEISVSFLPMDLETGPSAAAPGIPPRGDSYKPPISRGDSPASVTRKPVDSESPVHSASSSGHSQRSHGTSGSNASAITAAESPEAGPGAKDTTDSKPQGIRINTTTTVSNITYQQEPTFSSQTVLGQKPGIPQRPSTSHASGSPSFSPQGESAGSDGSVLPPPFKSPVSDLSMEEDIARVFGGGDTSASILRRVSNAVRHGRSFSDLATRTGSSPKWPRSPSGGDPGYLPFGGDITSPALSLGGKDDTLALKHELRRSTQRIAELEARLNSTASAKALDSNIAEKRNTVALLETEREAFLRELMVIKERVDAAKDGQPLNMEELKSDLIHGLTRELEDLKLTLKSEIQSLVAQRDQLTEEVENFARLRVEAIQDTEQLNLKNAQLADLNNELTRRIQGQFKANKTPVNGLGIYTGNAADLLDIKDQTEKRPCTATATSVSSSNMTGQINDTTHIHHHHEATEVFTAQKVTSLKNGPQIKKTFWKKGGAVMKGAGKGVNKLFAGSDREGWPSDHPNGVDSPGNLKPGGPDTPGGKIFGTQKKWMKNNKGGQNGLGAAGSSATISDGMLPLFGTDLEQRAEYEGNRIPNVVQKCIQEVEVRGMDFEGIYRKSGGASQMRQIQEAFERGDDAPFDSNVDICGVTSVLKQYFRNLPNPLLTYDIYERFVDTTTVFEEETRIKIVKDLVDELPSIHRDCLQFVIFHLARVASRRDENLMNARNLAVVFAPTLLRFTSDEREMTDMHAKNNAIQFLIDHNESIF
ncbi:RhoGAP-domain-containing protein [Choiromyces venosus 120613-1]|uniref:RhoGAP-domain-containing protein n=1 Tax=Choiromyces venosus 120613-1 TaxID=1336337 RepID=A0A3N4JBY5_9PEZI|nr:RhoGAP-domain-containing protein [Choiromyces venosus 120613-1]